MVSELDRVIEEGSAWRALSVFESVAMAAGGVESDAWKARHLELQAALADSPSFKLRLRLVAAIDALPANDQDFLAAVSGRQNWAQPASADRRESIAQRIATLDPSPSASPPPSSAPAAFKADKAPAPTAQAARTPRANDRAADPVSAAVRSIMDSLRVSVAIVTQADAQPPSPPAASAATGAAPRPGASSAPKPDLSTVAHATRQISAGPAAQKPALETPQTIAQPAGPSHPDLAFDEADFEEADVVVVQKKPLSTASLEQRLTQMDLEAAGLVRPAAPQSSNGLNARAEAPQPETFDEEADGFEAKVEIVRRQPSSSAASAPVNIRAAQPQSDDIDPSQRRQRSLRTDYPAEPAAAFIAETSEASVEIVRTNATPKNAWRPAASRDLEPIPVDRLLKTLSGNLNGS